MSLMIREKGKYVQYNTNGAVVAMCDVQMSRQRDTSVVNSSVVVTVRDYVFDTGDEGFRG